MSLGIIATVISTTVTVAALASAGVSIASAVGAFSPDNPGGNGTESTIVPKQQIIDLQTNLAALAEQDKKNQDELAKSEQKRKILAAATVGLGVLALTAGAFVAMKKKKT